jgi:hypothetical protein
MAGDWFCSGSCSSIHAALRGHVKAGAQPLPGEHSWQIMRARIALAYQTPCMIHICKSFVSAAHHSLCHDQHQRAAAGCIMWWLLQGRDGAHATTWALKAARDLLSESFDPIIDAITGRDMLAMMVMAQATGPWDYTGMHCVLLRHKVPWQPVCPMTILPASTASKEAHIAACFHHASDFSSGCDTLQGKPVAAALVRVFGHQLAELPLVATRYASRRQGHARVLMSAIDGLLAATGVQTLSLPAAQETVCDPTLSWEPGSACRHHSCCLQ